MIDRWRLGTIPKLWDDARSYLTDRLANLERILSVLHGAVEHPRPSVDARISCSLVTACTTLAAVDIAGATTTFTPAVDMTALVTFMFDVQCSLFGGAGQFFVGTLVVNGTAQAPQVVWSGNAINNRTMLTQQVPLTLKSGTSYSIKLQGAVTNVLTTFNVNNIHTGFVVSRFPNTYKPS